MIEYPLKCERCGGDFSSGDARIDDFLFLDEYCGRAICSKCDIEIIHIQQAAIRGISPAQYAQEILAAYGIKSEIIE